MRKFLDNYLLRLRLEKLYFSALRLLAKILSIPLVFAGRREEYLSYADLLALNRAATPAPKVTRQAYQDQQRKWYHRISAVAQTMPAPRILEVGCGTGWIAHMFSQNRQAIYANDIAFSLYPEVDPRAIRLALGDGGCLPYRDDTFDLVYSLNSFEHFDRPERILDEMVRVVRPGGMLFIAFSPIYFSPWGLHAARRLGMAYPQLLFSQATIEKYHAENLELLTPTYDDPKNNQTIGPYVNGFSVEQYRRMFHTRQGQLKTLAYVETLTFDGLRMIRKYPGLIRAKAPSVDDLFVSGIKYIGVKM